jgi:2-succinyl-5-enolpyruvyl-6-hydroxy-3-cyclohexene-1-carboxylate synthase
LEEQPTLTHILANNSAKKGLLIIGKLDNQEAMKVIELSLTLGWPVLCDPQSGVSSPWASYDIWLQNDEAALQLSQCEFIVQFGARLVSKRLLQFIDKQTAQWSPSDYVVVSKEPGRLNPNHSPMTRLQAIEINSSVPKSSQAGWADDLIPWAKRVANAASILFKTNLTELELAHRLHELTEGFDLFMGNSLGVRLVDMVCQMDTTKVYSNRGASGIDGIIATSAGVGVESAKPLLILLGDTSLLHDLNSLALMREQSSIIIVVNNDGGAIFDMLPVDSSHKQKLYQMPHGFHFKNAALQFGLSYYQPRTWNELANAVKHHDSSAQTTLLIEVVTEPGEASDHIKALASAIKG